MHQHLDHAEPRLAGDLAELLIFAILFLCYAFARAHDVALFNASGRCCWSAGWFL